MVDATAPLRESPRRNWFAVGCFSLVIAGWIMFAILARNDPSWMVWPYAWVVIAAPLVGIAGLFQDARDRWLAHLAFGCSLILPAVHLFVIFYFTFVDPLDFGPR